MMLHMCTNRYNAIPSGFYFNALQSFHPFGIPLKSPQGIKDRNS